MICFISRNSGEDTIVAIVLIHSNISPCASENELKTKCDKATLELRVSCGPFKISVSCLCPISVVTGFCDREPHWRRTLSGAYVCTETRKMDYETMSRTQRFCCRRIISCLGGSRNYPSMSEFFDGMERYLRKFTDGFASGNVCRKEAENKPYSQETQERIEGSIFSGASEVVRRGDVAWTTNLDELTRSYLMKLLIDISWMERINKSRPIRQVHQKSRPDG